MLQISIPIIFLYTWRDKLLELKFEIQIDLHITYITNEKKDVIIVIISQTQKYMILIIHVPWTYITIEIVIHWINFLMISYPNEASMIWEKSNEIFFPLYNFPCRFLPKTVLMSNRFQIIRIVVWSLHSSVFCSKVIIFTFMLIKRLF